MAPALDQAIDRSLNQSISPIEFNPIRIFCRNAENVEEAVALSLIEDLRTDVVTKLKQKIDERASAIFAEAAAASASQPGAKEGGEKPQTPFSAMIQAATRCVQAYVCVYVCMCVCMYVSTGMDVCTAYSLYFFLTHTSNQPINPPTHQPTTPASSST